MNLNSEKAQNIIIVILVVLTISISIAAFIKTKSSTNATDDLQLKPPTLFEENELDLNETDKEIHKDESPITITGNDIALVVDDEFSIDMLNISVTDIKDGELNYEIISNNIDTSVAGTYEVIIQATNSDSISVSKTFVVTVKQYDSEEIINTHPTISGNNITLNIGDLFSPSDLGITATDKEDGTLVYEIISNNVDTSKAGTYIVVVKTTDSEGLSASASFTIIINKPTTEESENTNPTISGNNITLNVGDLFSISDLGITATDKEDGTLKYSVVSNNVDTSKAGTYTVVIKTTDSKGLSASASFTIVINEVTPPKPENTNPTISGNNIILNVGDSFNILDLGITATDKEDGTLKYSVVSNNVDTSKAGTYTVVVRATDSKGLSVTATFTITVNEVAPPKPENTNPTISGNNITLNVGDSFNISDLGITATDKEDGTLKYSVVSNNVDTSKAGTYTIVVKTTDSAGLSATASFIVTVV